MKVKASQLIDLALDWAVAKCEEEQDRRVTVIRREDYVGKTIERETEFDSGTYEWWAPSRIWAQGGPIIDREELGFAKYGPNKTWKAVIGATPRGTPAYGPTPLVAAMRCYVATKLGDEVEIPDELMET